MPRSPENTESEPNSAQILEALDRVLKTDKFNTAPQMSAFLSYVVEQVVNGDKKRIKAYTVAVDALGKPATFDPQNDPVVRVLAGRLRASLTAYYETLPDTDVYIQMKPGSYIPIFRHYSATTEILAEIPAEDNNTLTLPSNHDATQPLAQLAIEAHDKTASNSVLTTAPQPVESLPDPDMARKNTNETTTNNVDLPSFLASLLRFPTVGVLLVLLSIGAAVLVKRTSPEPTVDQQITTMFNPAQLAKGASIRQRPDKVSVFVDASSGNDLLSDDLNAILSGVFLESNEIRVYRMLDGLTNSRYWPEDYLLSVEVLPLQSQTRVSVQFVEAQTGRISHSDSLTLSGTAGESLTQKELAKIRNFAQQLSSKNGPLLLDYKSRL